MTTMAERSVLAALSLALAMPVSARAEAPATPPAPAKTDLQAASSAGWLIGLAGYDYLRTGGQAGLGWLAGATVLSVGLVGGVAQWIDVPASYVTLIPGAIGGLVGVAVGDALAGGLTGYSPWALEAELLPTAPQLLIWAVSVTLFGSALAAGAITGSAKLSDMYTSESVVPPAPVR